MFVVGHSLQRHVLCANVVTNEVTRGQKVTNFLPCPKSGVQI